MAVRDKKIISGRAVDEDKTNQRHQIFSVSNYGRYDGAVHFTVFQPAGRVSLDTEFLLNLQDALVDTRKLHTRNGKLEAQKIVSCMMQQIKNNKHNEQSYFRLGMPANAITFNILYGKNFKINGINHELTKGLLIEGLDYGHAYNNLKSKEPDHDLQVMHDLAMYYKYDQKVDRVLLFEDVGATVTNIIQKFACHHAVRHNIGGIFKIPPTMNKPSDRKNRKRSDYGSTLDFERYINLIGCDKSRAVFPSTACRNSIDSLNLSALAVFEDEGRNAYPPIVLDGFINYHTLHKKAVI